jgi:hypothetical protein
MNIPSFLLNQTVIVKPYKGSSAYGPVYGGSLDLDPLTIVSHDPDEGSYVVKCHYEVHQTAENRRDANGNRKELKKLGKVWFNGSYLRPESIIVIDGQEYYSGTCIALKWLGNRTSHVEVVLT